MVDKTTIYIEFLEAVIDDLIEIILQFEMLPEIRDTVVLVREKLEIEKSRYRRNP